MRAITTIFHNTIANLKTLKFRNISLTFSFIPGVVSTNDGSGFFLLYYIQLV